MEIKALNVVKKNMTLVLIQVSVGNLLLRLGSGHFGK